MIVQSPRRVPVRRAAPHGQEAGATAAHQRVWSAALLMAAVLGMVATAVAAVTAFDSANAHPDPTAGGSDLYSLGANGTVADTGEVGETFAYPNGVSVTVGRLRLARASTAATGANPRQLLAVAEVQVVNNSRGTLPLGTLEISARVGPKDRHTGAVTDPRLPERLAGVLAPGQHATGSYAFSLDGRDEARDVAIELSPGYAYRWATFEGAAR